MGARFPASEQCSSAASTQCQSGFTFQPFRIALAYSFSHRRTVAATPPLATTRLQQRLSSPPLNCRSTLAAAQSPPRTCSRISARRRKLPPHAGRPRISNTPRRRTSARHRTPASATAAAHRRSPPHACSHLSAAPPPATARFRPPCLTSARLQPPRHTLPPQAASHLLPPPSPMPAWLATAHLEPPRCEPPLVAARLQPPLCRTSALCGRTLSTATPRRRTPAAASLHITAARHHTSATAAAPHGSPLQACSRLAAARPLDAAARLQPPRRAPPLAFARLLPPLRRTSALCGRALATAAPYPRTLAAASPHITTARHHAPATAAAPRRRTLATVAAHFRSPPHACDRRISHPQVCRRQAAPILSMQPHLHSPGRCTLATVPAHLRSQPTLEAATQPHASTPLSWSCI
jgi:hypothetical protein